jgi:ABC-type Fe3+ transport system substrate-binding protein
VTVEGGFSNVLTDKINSQISSGKFEGDMAFLQTVQDFVGWKKQGALISYRHPGYDQQLPAYQDSDGAFTTTKVNPIGYAYNSKLVSAQDVPRSAADFLKPMFAGKAISCYPADDDATLYVFHSIVQKYGWSWMDQYMSNRPNFVQGHLSVARSLASGENVVTFDATSSVLDLRSKGAPVEFTMSEQDATPIFTLCCGIFKGAPHPNAAKLFQSWYMAPEQQARTGVFSSRTDVPPPAGFQPLTSYNLANEYRDFVSNAALMTELRHKIESYTGPVVNKGGIR